MKLRCMVFADILQLFQCRVHDSALRLLQNIPNKFWKSNNAQKESRFPKGCILVTRNIVNICNRYIASLQKD